MLAACPGLASELRVNNGGVWPQLSVSRHVSMLYGFIALVAGLCVRTKLFPSYELQ